MSSIQTQLAEGHVARVESDSRICVWQADSFEGAGLVLDCLLLKRTGDELVTSKESLRASLRVATSHVVLRINCLIVLNLVEDGIAFGGWWVGLDREPETASREYFRYNKISHNYLRYKNSKGDKQYPTRIDLD